MTDTPALLLLLGLVIPLTAAAESATATDDDLWRLLRHGDHAALMRHALAPGIGDPPDFRLDDCATQRNLSDRGRAQAAAIGDAFRVQGISEAEVLSSQWCRCLETARLLALGTVAPFPGVNSFFRNRSRERDRTAAVTSLLQDKLSDDDRRPLVLVTHQVNITALTGVVPDSGEIVVVQFDGNGLKARGSLRPPRPPGR